MQVAIWTVVLFIAQQSAAQPPLNVWASNGPGPGVNSLVIDPNNPNILYAARPYGNPGVLFKSVDNGANWSTTTQMMVLDLAVDGFNLNTVYAAVSTGVAKSVDGGVNWNLILSIRAQKIAVSQSDPSIIYAAVGGSEDNSPIDVHVSTNAGATWVDRPIPNSTHFDPIVLAVDPHNPDIIYVHGRDYDDLGTYKSIDGGTSWAAISGSSTLTIDPRTPNTLYCGFYNGVHKSTDGGDTWQHIGFLGPGLMALAIDPVSPGTIYAGTWDGVQKSTDDGATWVGFSNGLPNRPGDRVMNFAFDRSGRFLHGLTGAAVFSVRVREDVAPHATVSGRVMTATGFGIRNAMVSITDLLGVRRIVTTGSLGY